MIRLIKAFFHDGLSWVLAVILLVTFLCSVTSLFNRLNDLDEYKYNLWELESDITLLHSQLEQKKEWEKRLESNPTAWEQVAREKMNYLGPDETLVTFKAEEKTAKAEIE